MYFTHLLGPKSLPGQECVEAASHSLLQPASSKTKLGQLSLLFKLKKFHFRKVLMLFVRSRSATITPKFPSLLAINKS